MGFLAFISRSGPGLAGHSWPVKPEQERKSAEGLYIESSIEFFTASPQMSSLKMATFIPAKLVSFQAGTNNWFVARVGGFWKRLSQPPGGCRALARDSNSDRIKYAASAMGLFQLDVIEVDTCCASTVTGCNLLMPSSRFPSTVQKGLTGETSAQPCESSVRHSLKKEQRKENQNEKVQNLPVGHRGAWHYSAPLTPPFSSEAFVDECVSRLAPITRAGALLR